MSKVTDIKEYKDGRKLKDFILFPKKLLNDHTVKASTKMVYAALAQYTNNETGICTPALNTLANDTGFHKRTVARAIDDLVEKGYVIRRQRSSSVSDKNLSNEYKLF